MAEKKPYLQPELSLTQLAKLTDIPPRHLSQIINEHMRQNFYDFINQYRIEQSKQMMRDRTKEKWTILEILYESGFNSKTTFNTTFKKKTGMTPTAYRQRILTTPQ